MPMKRQLGGGPLTTKSTRAAAESQKTSVVPSFGLGRPRFGNRGGRARRPTRRSCAAAETRVRPLRTRASARPPTRPGSARAHSLPLPEARPPRRPAAAPAARARAEPPRCTEAAGDRPWLAAAPPAARPPVAAPLRAAARGRDAFEPEAVPAGDVPPLVLVAPVVAALLLVVVGSGALTVVVVGVALRTVVVVGTGALTVVVGSRTVVVGSLTVVVGSLTVVVGSRTVVVGSRTVVVGSLTVVVGSRTVVVGSRTVAVGSLTLVVGSPTLTVGTAAGAAAAPLWPSVCPPNNPRKPTPMRARSARPVTPANLATRSAGNEPARAKSMQRAPFSFVARRLRYSRAQRAR